MLEKRRYVLEHFDHVRQLIMREPRGHDAMYGAILTQPATDDGDIGVLFIETGGMGTMCGHGTIGVSKAVFEAGLVPSQEGTNVLKIDAPAGRVVSYVEVRNRHVTSVSFHNVPAFLYQSEVKVVVEEIGEVRVDVAFGGAFYLFVNSRDLDIEIAPEKAEVLRLRAMQIQKAFCAQHKVALPLKPDISWVYGTAIVAPVEIKGDRIVSRNIMVFGEGEIDRSPCGTGTSARLEQLYAKGILKLDMTLESHSIIDTVFDATIVEEVTVADYRGVVPRVTGRAYIMGINQLLLEPDDPMPQGFRV
jgi:proline racemase